MQEGGDLSPPGALSSRISPLRFGMTLCRNLSLVISALALAACATPPPAWMVKVGPTPSDEQVIAYVRKEWAESYAFYFGRRLGVQPDATLVSITDVKCRYRHRVPDCTFTVTGQLTDGTTRRLRMHSSFEWQDDGSLEEIIIIIGG